MFKSITLNLTGPICKCKVKNIRLEIDTDLQLECKSCGVTYIIPSKSITWSLKLDTPYPAESNQDNALSIKKELI